MEELSLDIVAYLQSQTAVTDIVGADIYAVIAPEHQQFPFVAFTINDQSPATKESDEFNVSIFLWFSENEYTKAMKFTDAVTAVVKNKEDWDWLGSSFQFVEENISYCGIINFKKT